MDLELVPSKHKKVLDGGSDGRPLTYRRHLGKQARPAPAPKPGEAVASEPTGPSFMMALQLGLKLETTKGPVEFLVIDRIERPSAN
jgi:uncharacterized protein (TIGR03435 family)